MELHANLFRATFADPVQAAGLLRTFLPPAVAAAIDWRTLQLCDTEFIDPALRRSVADLLFSADLGDRPLLPFVVPEHKSWQDPLTALQMLRYEVRVFEQWLRDHPGATSLPLILALVVHHGPRGWQCARDVRDLFDLVGLPRAVVRGLRPHLPQLRFLLADLPEHDLERLRRSAMPPLAQLVLSLMQHLRGQDAAGALAVMQQLMDLVLPLFAAPGGAERLRQVWFYAFRGSDLVPEQLLDLLPPPIGPSVADAIMTFADRVAEETRRKMLAEEIPRIRAEERERAHAEERERARIERSHVLLRQIERRFGPADAESRTRIEQATTADLDRWSDAVLDAPSLAALFAG